MVKTHVSVQGGMGSILVRELRFGMLCEVAKRIKKKLKCRQRKKKKKICRAE